MDMGASQRPQNAVKGEQIEQYRARERDGEHVGSGAWFDVENPDGSPTEVKSARQTLASGRSGRFRLWLDQHANLKDHGGDYDLVLTADDRTVAEVTVEPEEIDEVIDEHDLTWAQSGDHPKGNRQIKLVWSHIIDPDEVDA